MNKVLEAALEYQEKGYPVIPLNPYAKKPFFTIEEFFERKPTKAEIEKWWREFPTSMIGIITGKISDLFVLDLDPDHSPEEIASYIPDNIVTPTSTTPRKGQHLYFKCPEDERITIKTGLMKGVDYRCNHGYIVAPPSRNGYGKGYSWCEGLSLFKVEIQHLPAAILNNIILSLYKRASKDPTHQTASERIKGINLFVKGKRNEDLWHVAYSFIKGKMYEDEVLQHLEIYGKACDPPWGSIIEDEPLETILNSVLKYVNRKERNLTAEIRQWVGASFGTFSASKLYQDASIASSEEKHYARTVLSRMVGKEIARVGNQDGMFRKIDGEIKFMDFLNVDPNNTVNLILPLNIHKKTVFFPKSVIVLAGVTGFGKTTFALNFIKGNWNHYNPIYYFNAEMSPQALHKKLSYFKDTSISEWYSKMKVIGDWDYRDIGDKIFPDSINVIDYLEPEGEKSFNIHEVIVGIMNNLKSGIAFITIQKKPGAVFGTGGVYSVKAASLALTLEWGNVSIYKNRFREEDLSPSLDSVDFEITGGSKIEEKGVWYNSKIGKAKSDKYKSFTKED